MDVATGGSTTGGMALLLVVAGSIDGNFDASSGGLGGVSLAAGGAVISLLVKTVGGKPELTGSVAAATGGGSRIGFFGSAELRF